MLDGNVGVVVGAAVGATKKNKKWMQPRLGHEFKVMVRGVMGL
jgi:hypothetical protein